MKKQPGGLSPLENSLGGLSPLEKSDRKLDKCGVLLWFAK